MPYPLAMHLSLRLGSRFIIGFLISIALALPGIGTMFFMMALFPGLPALGYGGLIAVFWGTLYLVFIAYKGNPGAFAKLQAACPEDSVSAKLGGCAGMLAVLAAVLTVTSGQR